MPAGAASLCGPWQQSHCRPAWTMLQIVPAAIEGDWRAHEKAQTQTHNNVRHAASQEVHHFVMTASEAILCFTWNKAFLTATCTLSHALYSHTQCFVLKNWEGSSCILMKLPRVVVCQNYIGVCVSFSPCFHFGLWPCFEPRPRSPAMKFPDIVGERLSGHPSLTSVCYLWWDI